MIQYWLLLLRSIGEAAEVVLYGWLEYTVDSKCHYPVNELRTHYSVDGRAHYTAQLEDK